MNDWLYVIKEKDRSIVMVIAQIRCNKTGQVVEYETNEVLEKDKEHPSTFNWADNNFSCDCNRHLFFNRVKNEEETDIECSDGKYSVNLLNRLTREVYYREFE